ncbi:MAG: hypothetical protein JWN61_2621 [Pseudonocardiales bacterium]|nr:hypothetical protein [Pseudonocardiales bacterium]
MRLSVGDRVLVDDCVCILNHTPERLASLAYKVGTSGDGERAFLRAWASPRISPVARAQRAGVRQKSLTTGAVVRGEADERLQHRRGNRHARVVAHLSEPIGKHLPEDLSTLSDFLIAEMRYGILAAVEAKVVADLQTTSGIQLRTFAANCSR